MPITAGRRHLSLEKSGNLAGIYIHIPFCKKKCNYCNFFSIASKNKLQGFSKLLIAELRLRKPFLEGHEVNTIYFGGGTPSLLPVNDINDIYDEIKRSYHLSGEVEITLEANPDDLDPGYLNNLSASRVNRLSIGIQSFSNDDLKFLGRVHDAEQAEKSVQNALKAGFKNISADLIYGIPGQDNESWIANLNKISEYNIPHLSAYWLTVEAKTSLGMAVEKGKVAMPDEDVGYRHFGILREWSRQKDYEHYEISNLSRPGMHSRHNSAYWDSQVYLGIGPSAHSYDGNARYWAVSGIDEYSRGIASGKPNIDSEILCENDHYNEYVMTRLRTKRGCNIEDINTLYGPEKCEFFENNIKPFIISGLVSYIKGQYTLTETGMLRADGVSSALFVV